MPESSKNKFKEAVEKTADIYLCFQPRLQALGKNSSKIVPENPNVCEGSVDIDKCTREKYPNSSRWDYAIGYENKVYFIEVHSAETSEIGAIIKKLEWLKKWLKTNAVELNDLKASSPYFWIRSGRYAITKDSPQARRLSPHGIKPMAKVKLPPKD